MGVSKQKAGNSQDISSKVDIVPKNLNTKNNLADQYIGRFAPSPTGPLHFGSLIAATASYLCARQHQKAKWLLRIEDIDTQRSRKEHASSIVKTLEDFGFQWDDKIIFQSERTKVYQHILDTLQPHTYSCSCTRKQLSAASTNGKYGYIYPGNCRKTLSDKSATNLSTRIKTKADLICFQDQCQGQFCQSIEEEVGDFILKRSDNMFAYQLAVVVDDNDQCITHIVRGADLLDNTPRQIYLQQLLSYTPPQYLHFPVATTADGRKLSKKNISKEISIQNKRLQLIDALRFLGQETPNNDDFESLDDFWSWAVQNWDSSLIPQKMKIHYE